MYDGEPTPTEFVIDTEQQGDVLIIRVSRDIISEEDERSYDNRLFRRDYDTNAYPYFNYDDWINQTMIDPNGYKGDLPPIGRYLLATETVELEFKQDIISRVTIEVEQGTYEIRYKQGKYDATLINGETVENEASILKVAIAEQSMSSLKYYGVLLYDKGELQDEALRFTSEDRLLGINGVPYFIGNYKDDKWHNIRPYNAIMNSIFTLLFKPFTLQRDLPNEDWAIEVWYLALRELVNHGFKYPYLMKFFDGLSVTDNITEWKGYKMVTIEYNNSLYHSFLKNRKIYAMMAEIGFSTFLYFIRNDKGYQIPHVDTEANISQRYTNVAAYVGNRPDLNSDEGFIQVRVNRNSCYPDPSYATMGLVCTRTSIYDPFWDPFSVLLHELQQ